MTEITKASPIDAGCWIDGHTGHYGPARVIEIAHDYGYDKDGAMCQEYLYGDTSSPKCEYICEASDEAEAWLNKNIAPEGFSFGWHDGEFFLWSDETWNEE